MTPTSLRFLGSGDAFGSGGRFQACVLLRHADAAVLLDCGASSLIALKSAGVDPSTVDAVLVSHLHGDHFGGLPFLLLDGQFSRRERPLTIAGPPGLAARLESAMEALFPGSSQTRRRFATRIVELEERVAQELHDIAVTAYTVDHASGAPAYALRLQLADRVVAYSGDTAWTETLLEVARDADPFICEAYGFDKPIPYHLDFRTLEAQWERLGCRSIVLTHMSAEMLRRAEAGAVDPDRYQLAHDGLVLDL